MVFENLDPHQIYSIISNWILYLIIIMTLILITLKLRYHLITLERLKRLFKKYPKIINILFIIIILTLIILFGITKYIVYQMDASNKVIPKEKIVIIEIDDYWNMNETSTYFGPYGYSMDNYYSVSNLLDKYEFTASLGVTPFIFVEDIRENFPLKEDKEMISYLKELENKGYELAMHGYNHCRNEYYCPAYEEVWFNVLDGKLELEKIFNKEFTTYLPPGNAWTTEQYENVKKAGFKIIGNTHVPQAYFDEDVIITNRGYDPIIVYEWYAINFIHSDYIEWIEALSKTDLFILQLHSNTFDSQEKLNDLDKFLTYLKENNIKVVTYEKAYKLLNKK